MCVVKEDVLCNDKSKINNANGRGELVWILSAEVWTQMDF